MPPLSNADLQRRHQCPICNGWIWGNMASKIGVHQRCDRAGYMREYRKLKAQEQE